MLARCCLIHFKISIRIYKLFEVLKYYRMHTTLRYCCNDVRFCFKYIRPLLAKDCNIQSERRRGIKLRILKDVNKGPMSVDGEYKKGMNLANKLNYGPLIPVAKSKTKKTATKKKTEDAEKKISETMNVEERISETKTTTKRKKKTDVEKSVREIIDIKRFSETMNVVSIDHTDWQVPVRTLNLNEIISAPISRENCDESSEDDGKIRRIHIFEGGYTKLPSVRKVLSTTMPPEQKLVLENWQKKKILELGEEGFKQFSQGLIDRGSLLHGCIEMNLSGEDDPNEDQLVGIEPFWESIQHVLPKLTDIKVLESRIIHPTLHYQGAVDCVATFRDKLVVAEFKTSSKPKMTLNATYDDPMQLMAYIGALNHDRTYNHLPQVSGALLVIAYQTGLPAHIHHLTPKQCQNYWSKWLHRLAKFWQMEGKPA